MGRKEKPMDAYRYLINLIEGEKRRAFKRKRTAWVLGNINFARASGQITAAQAVELVMKLKGENE